LLLIGATTVFAELQGDLDRIWKAPAAEEIDRIGGCYSAVGSSRWEWLSASGS
jgi:hypothetical protein